MLGPSPPVYCNKVDELVAFESQQAAESWLKENALDTSGTPILIPFKGENDTVHFLRPTGPNLLSNPEDKTNIFDANEDIRIMGAANSGHVHKFIDKIKAALTSNRVPHLNELEGETISLVDHGFIVIYKKGEIKVGHQFVKFFEEEKQSLLDKIKTAQTNEEPRINAGKFLEKLSTLALGLGVKTGMTYFVIADKAGNQHVYRQTFRQDPNNINVESYLKKELKCRECKPVKVKEHKSQNHHIVSFLKDWLKWTVFAAITAIGAGLILGIFITPPIGAIAAGLVAVVTFIGASSYGFHRADKNNPTTIEFGIPEFVTESETTFFSRIKLRINNLYKLIFRRSNGTVDLSNGNIGDAMSTDQSRLSTIAVNITTKSGSNQTILLLAKAGLQRSLLFDCQEKNPPSTRQGEHCESNAQSRSPREACVDGRSRKRITP